MRTSIVLLACLIHAFGFAPSLHAAENKELIAVLDLQGVDTREAEVSALTNRLREVLLKSGRFTLVDRSQMEAVLDEQALQQTGCTSQECAVQVGRLLGVRKIVAGEVIKISPEIWLVSALMVDVETAETLRVESIRHRGDFFSLMDEGIAEFGYKLVPGATPAPGLAVNSPPTVPAAPEPAPVLPTTAGMIAIPGGEFAMGTDAAHRMVLDAFLIDATEVTQQAFAEQFDFNPSRPVALQSPVNNVNWQLAKQYCTKIGKRLPTEAEWERAARAGTSTKYFFGDRSTAAYRYANTCGEACWDGNVDRIPEQDGYLSLAPVASLKPNPWGIYDIYGNVAEWVTDWFLLSPFWTQPNPQEPPSGKEKVVRGGSFRTFASSLSSASREAFPPETQSETIGFRCAANSP